MGYFALRIFNSLKQLFINNEEENITSDSNITDADERVHEEFGFSELSELGNVIFCDIDGVYHTGNSGSFRYLLEFEKMISKYDISIVISSDWRKKAKFSYLKSLYSSYFQYKVIGAIPYKNGMTREEQIHKFCSLYNVSKWIAVDDNKQLFSESCPELFLVDPKTALDCKTMSKLEIRIQKDLL